MTGLDKIYNIYFILINAIANNCPYLTVPTSFKTPYFVTSTVRRRNEV